MLMVVSYSVVSAPYIPRAKLMVILGYLLQN